MPGRVSASVCLKVCSSYPPLPKNSNEKSSLEPRITQSVKELGDLLLAIKGGGQPGTLNQPAQRQQVAVEADEVLRPLMDLLDGSLSLYAQSCEKTVLKRLLKELWRIVMRILEKTVVLPPMTDKTVSVYGKRYHKQGVQIRMALGCFDCLKCFRNKKVESLTDYD